MGGYKGGREPSPPPHPGKFQVNIRFLRNTGTNTPREAHGPLG